jgi:hypothetical protein
MVMFFAGVFLFSIAVLIVSYAVSNIQDPDKGKLAFFTTLVAWGSLLAGMMLSRVSLISLISRTGVYHRY